MPQDAWRVWDKNDAYGQVLYKRAVGELEEMESAKALCAQVSPLYKKGMNVLDVGCGAGHYLASLRKRVDTGVDYTGVDATESYINLARKAFGESAKFTQGDIEGLPFKDASFDIVMCNNVLMHLPPPLVKPLSELIRVAKKYVVIRTLFGERNYVIQEVRTGEEISGLPEREGDAFDDYGKARSFNYFNLYTENYFRDVLAGLGSRLHIEIKKDNDWKPFDNRTDCGKVATRVVDGKQVSGNVILDYRFIVLSKQ